MESILKVGDVVLVRNNEAWYNPGRWLSVFIQLFTGCRYTHCGIISTDITTGEMCFNSALETGVGQQTPEKAFSGKQILVRRPVDKVPIDFTERANSYVGKTRYDFKALFEQFPIYLITGDWIGSDSIKEMDCSVYVAVVELWDRPWECSPASVKNNGGFTNVFESVIQF